MVQIKVYAVYFVLSFITLPMQTTSHGQDGYFIFFKMQSKEGFTPTKLNFCHGKALNVHI
jgi:hypothetical protein